MKVDYITHSGDDLLVANAARKSYGKGFEEFSYIPRSPNGRSDDELINDLARDGHMLPFRHPHITISCSEALPIARQLGKHQVGLCLSGDTEVTFVKKIKGYSNGTFTKSLSYIADMWFGKIKYQGGLKGKLNVTNSHIRVFNESTQRFETSHITNVIDSGIKDVFKITDNYGNTLKATENHQLLTDCGWKELKDITLSDKLIRSDMGETFAKTELRYNNWEDKQGRRSLRKTILDVDNCDTCNKTFNKSELEADHIIPVNQGGLHNLDNLQKLCTECHAIKTKQECEGIVGSTTLLPKYVEIVSIEFVGQEQCYDISVDTIHNFIGNGFVVHNCWSEISRRYKTKGIKFTLLDGTWRYDIEDRHQGSGELMPIELQTQLEIIQANNITNCLKNYQNALDLGASPEQCRYLLPQSMNAEWTWTGSLLAFAHLYKQRNHPDAQKEVRDFAIEVGKIMEELYPISWKALLNN